MDSTRLGSLWGMKRLRATYTQSGKLGLLVFREGGWSLPQQISLCLLKSLLFLAL